MIYLAHDGSLNDDWVARYAISLARTDAAHALVVLHVKDGAVPPAAWDQKLARLKAECADAGVAATAEIIPRQGSVFESLTARLPESSDTYLVCGARVRGGERGFLAGTVSSALMRWEHCNVLAVRVAQPGLLGSPGRVLLPVGGHRDGLRHAIPYLRLLAPMLKQVHLLRVTANGGTSKQKREATRTEGMRDLVSAERELIETAGLAPELLDASVVAADSVPGGILVAASRLKSHLIFMEAARRDLGERFFFTNPLEQVLRDSPCDVAMYRGA